MIYDVFLAVVETFTIFLLGAWIFHKKYLNSKDLQTMNNIVMDVFIPLLSFSTVVKNFNQGEVRDLWLMPLIGFMIMAVSYFLGCFFKMFLKNKSDNREVTFHHICTVNNFLFLPLIVLSNLYGGAESQHVSLLLLMNVGSKVSLWTFGMLSFSSKIGWKEVQKSIFSINVLAVLFAVFWSFLPIAVPEFLLKAASSVGGLSVPLMLVLVGGALYENYQKLFFDIYDLIYANIVRLFVIPIILILIWNTLNKFYNFPVEVYQVVFIVLIMPAASSSVLYAKAFGGNDRFASQIILSTSIFSLGTMLFLIKMFMN